MKTHSSTIALVTMILLTGCLSACATPAPTATPVPTATPTPLPPGTITGEVMYEHLTNRSNTEPIPDVMIALCRVPAEGLPEGPPVSASNRDESEHICTLQGTPTALTDTEGFDFSYPDKLSPGESATIWLVSHKDGYLDCSTEPCFTPNNGKKLWICWGDLPAYTDQAYIPAIVATIYYDTSGNSLGSTPDYSNVKVARVAFNGKQSSHADNNFTTTNHSQHVFDFVGQLLDGL